MVKTVLILSRRRAILKYLALPANTDAELRKLIKLRLVDIAVTSPEKIVWDYIQIGRDLNGYTKVLIFIMNKEMVEQEIGVLSRNGLVPSGLTLTSLALHRWFVFQMESSKQAIDHPVALINLNSQDAEICFVDKNYLYFSHYINLGLIDLPAQIGPFMQQVHSAISTYRNEKIGEDISGFMITADSEALLSELQKVYGFPVDVLNSTEGLAKVYPEINFTQPGTAILGALFSDGIRSLNLIPDKVKNSKSLNWNKSDKRRLTVLFLLTCFLGIAAWSAGLVKKSVHLWGLRAQAAKMEPKIREIDELNRKIRVLKEESYGQLLVADLMDKLSSLSPEDLNYQFIQLDENKDLVLEGDADFGSSVDKLQEQLVGSNYFTDVDLEYAAKKQTPDGELTHFKINCHFVAGPDGAKDI